MWICGGKEVCLGRMKGFRWNDMIKWMEFYFDGVVWILVEKGVISVEEEYVDGSKIEWKGKK